MQQDKKEKFEIPSSNKLLVLDLSREDLQEMCETKIKHLISIIDRLFERTSTLGNQTKFHFKIIDLTILIFKKTK